MADVGPNATIGQVLKGGRHGWQPHLAGITSIFGNRTPAEIMSFDDSDQQNQELRTGLEFLLGHVLWFDILACVSTGTIPHLPHRTWLDIQELQTAEVMGCSNWVLLSIGNLAELNYWKKDKMQRGILSVRELVDRGREIEDCLQTGLQSLGATTEVRLFSFSFLKHFFFRTCLQPILAQIGSSGVPDQLGVTSLCPCCHRAAPYDYVWASTKPPRDQRHCDEGSHGSSKRPSKMFIQWPDVGNLCTRKYGGWGVSTHL